ncbi:MAG: sulfatase-like hydrolase/transferase, partial [Putridiphycobacter sp.]|nr:sulfatase-like hydrolase/transferase [Putridiphycobacter sp.]
FISIYQTLTNHSPYNLAPEQYYSESYLKSRLGELGRQLNKIIIAPNIISSILSADDALHFFINEFKKDERFNNTIFIIVGDHAVNLNLRKHALERFHVPLIIYSPLIEKSAAFAGMCSHIDIAPSLLALLENNFDLVFSPEKHFIGEGLDTSITFNANRSIPLTVNRMETPSFIVNSTMMQGNNYYDLDENWDSKLASEANKAFAVKRIKSYKIINKIVCDENRIWPFPKVILHNRYLVESSLRE